MIFSYSAAFSRPADGDDNTLKQQPFATVALIRRRRT
jgi:hypothetical protein